MTKQHLSEPLNKYLLKIVNHEADKEWSKIPQVPIPSYKVPKVESKRAWGLLVALHRAVQELKP